MASDRDPSKRRSYEPFMEKGAQEKLEKVQEAYEHFQETQTFRHPEHMYGEPKGELFTIEVEDCPDFGDTAHVELDSGRTAFLSIDMQRDFCGEDGYVDAMGYDLQLTADAIEPIKNVMETVRKTDVDIIHTREGHAPDLADAPFNKLLRSKLAGDGFGIGETPPGGIGPLLVRGSENWDIIDELYPEPGEPVIDKPGKGAFGISNIDLVLNDRDIRYLVISGITTDVCVHTIMRQANDLGYWCILLKDGTGATDENNCQAAIKQIKMQGGVFGWVTDSETFIEALKGLDSYEE